MRESPGPVREPVRVVGLDGGGGSVARLLERLQAGAFQGRKLGEAFETLKRTIDGSTLICAGLAGSMASAGLWPLLTWLVERGYVDLVVSTAANVTEDLLEQRGVSFHRVDPEHGLVSARSLPAQPGGLVVFVENVDNHYHHAKSAGAIIDSSPTDQPYGQREYSARDPEGNLWYFATRIG